MSAKQWPWLLILAGVGALAWWFWRQQGGESTPPPAGSAAASTGQLTFGNVGHTVSVA